MMGKKKRKKVSFEILIRSKPNYLNIFAIFYRPYKINMLLIGHVFIQEGDDDTNKRKKRMKVSEVKELERRTEKISKLQEKRIQKYEVRNTVFNL
jgi:hypothetical protein